MKRISLAAATLFSCAFLYAQDPAPPAPIMTVTLLGTGVPLLDPVAYVASGRVNSGLMVVAGKERMLFDCGQGVLGRLLQSGGPVDNPNAAVNRVFISHLHSDHYADLPALYAYGWLFRYNDPLVVWGPGPGPNGPISMGVIMPLLRAVFDTDIFIRSALFSQLTFPTSGVQPMVHELSPGVVYSSNGVTVTAFLVNHSPVNPAYGFRVDYMGHSVVYSGDTRYDPATQLVKMSTGVDVLIHEVWGYDKSVAPELFGYHTVVEDTATVFNAAKPKLAVYTHEGIPSGTSGSDLVSRARIAGYTGPLQLGADLMVINVLPNFVSVDNPAPHDSVIPFSALSVALPAAARSLDGGLPAEIRALHPAAVIQ